MITRLGPHALNWLRKWERPGDCTMGGDVGEIVQTLIK